MIDAKNLSLSESMQMYLVTIARLWKNDQPVPLSHLAEMLDISPVSANEMCRKLQDNGLVNYQPYKGALLTDEGQQRANYILRRHRLWEVFLVHKLGFSYQEAHEIACQLEHATPNLLADRLDDYLGNPGVNPVGEPIPAADEKKAVQPVYQLKELTIEQQGYVVQCEVDDNTRTFLEQQGIRPGVLIKVIAVSPNGMLVQANESMLTMAHSLTAIIRVVLSENSNLQNTHSLDSPVEKEKQYEDVSTMQATNQMKQDQIEVQRLPLHKVKVGQRAVVVRVGGKGAVKRRMMDMGLVSGAEVKMVRKAPLGDPIEFLVKGYSLSLRKSEAADIEVELIS